VHHGRSLTSAQERARSHGVERNAAAVQSRSDEPRLRHAERRQARAELGIGIAIGHIRPVPDQIQRSRSSRFRSSRNTADQQQARDVAVLDSQIELERERGNQAALMALLNLRARLVAR